MRRQKPTNSDGGKWTLTPKQRATLDLLAAGTSVTDAAEAMTVSRQTVSDWLHHHHGFQAALNRRRRELWTNVSDRLRALLPKALTVLEREIGQGDTELAARCMCSRHARSTGPRFRSARSTPPRERGWILTITAPMRGVDYYAIFAIDVH